MMRSHIALTIVILSILMPFCASGQITGVEDQKEFTDSLKHELEFGPYFGLYKDNYFVAGTTPFHKPTATNSDVKFQISLAVRLTDKVLPWDSFLFLMYTQKTFWNVFENSMPMHDMNFNPGIGWSKPFFNKDRYVAAENNCLFTVNDRGVWIMDRHGQDIHDQHGGIRSHRHTRQRSRQDRG